MNCEDFTYSAHEADYSARYAAGPDEALSLCTHGAYSAGPLPEAVIRFWMWMQLQLAGYFEKTAAPRSVSSEPSHITSEPSHIFQLPSADPSAPARAVRVNRSMLRKLRRLRRVHPPSYFNSPAYRLAGPRDDLSTGQYLELLIRLYGWNRVLTYRLGRIKRKSIGISRWRFRLKGRAVNLDMAVICNALLSPD